MSERKVDFAANVCDACDGDGSLSHQWAKADMVKCGGKAVLRVDMVTTYSGLIAVNKSPRLFIDYVDDRGNDILFKTIGGRCGKCEGNGTVPLQIGPTDGPKT